MSTATPLLAPWDRLPAEVSIYTVAELRLQWLTLLQRQGGEGDTVELDGSAVEQFDAAGAQSLLSLAHALGARGQRLQLSHASTTLAEACRVLGLGDLIVSTAGEA
ncbi:anti-anti-sigma regulatory factor [Pelomonas saccharophila]|uniref:Anti-anti-sigma regulatory factor n=1 Tax=Roseateles saccharophilus TaxID=304 RepID=A0ABU1YK81_ROSSA|nr:STAS domain-containing protein [Roseateles saccharophilus]MDR7269262.1 anti-anti-sigma regulatory factor [Roseateles saccharophilus]